MPQIMPAIASAAFGLTCALSASAHGHDTRRDVELTVTELYLGIHELSTDQSGNTVIVHGDDGVLMIDTQMEHLAPHLEQALVDITGQSTVELIINTHLHRDHVRGNAHFSDDGTKILAHPNVRRFLEAPRAILALGRTAPNYSDELLPHIGVSDQTVVYFNGQTIKLHYAPAAHTDGDIFVHIEEANVIHAGDLLYAGRFPFIDIDNGGSVQGFLDGMQAIVELADEDTIIVAGHGPLSTETNLEDSIAMVGDAYRRVEVHVERGLKLAQILELDVLSDLRAEWDWAFIDADRMVTVLYYDLTNSLE